MAYSFIATTTTKPDWEKLHANVFRPDTAIEMFPIQSDESDKHYLGICIPFHKLDQYPNTWNDLIKIITVLKVDYNFEIFDLYNGFYVNDKNLKQVKKSLTS